MKGLIWVIVLVVVLGAGYFYFSNQNTAEVVDSNLPVNEEPMVDEQPEPMAGAYNVVTSETTLTYNAERIVGNSHTGTVPVSGYVNLEEDVFEDASFTIDMTQITESNNNEMFLGHMASEDFFNTSVYPTATLVIKSLEPSQLSASSAHTVTADLTIKGITNEITFPATLSLDNGTLTGQANIEIDRTRWDIVYDSGNFFQDLGDKAIRDEVTFTLELVARN